MSKQESKPRKSSKRPFWTLYRCRIPGAAPAGTGSAGCAPEQHPAPMCQALRRAAQSRSTTAPTSAAAAVAATHARPRAIPRTHPPAAAATPRTWRELTTSGPAGARRTAPPPAACSAPRAAAAAAGRAGLRLQGRRPGAAGGAGVKRVAGAVGTVLHAQPVAWPCTSSLASLVWHRGLEATQRGLEATPVHAGHIVTAALTALPSAKRRANRVPKQAAESARCWAV